MKLHKKQIQEIIYFPHASNEIAKVKTLYDWIDEDEWEAKAVNTYRNKKCIAKVEGWDSLELNTRFVEVN